MNCRLALRSDKVAEAVWYSSWAGQKVAEFYGHCGEGSQARIRRCQDLVQARASVTKLRLLWVHGW